MRYEYRLLQYKWITEVYIYQNEWTEKQGCDFEWVTAPSILVNTLIQDVNM